MQTDLEILKTVQVEKRDQTITPFYPYKIKWVLEQLHASETVQVAVISDLIKEFADKKLIQTKQIAATIKEALLKNGQPALAQIYGDYRRRDEENFAQATDPQVKLKALFGKNDRVVHENANKDSKVFNTQRDLEAGVVSRALGLKMLPEVVAKAHLRGDLHWHDLDYSPVTPETNCCLIDFNPNGDRSNVTDYR